MITLRNGAIRLPTCLAISERHWTIMTHSERVFNVAAVYSIRAKLILVI